MSIEVRADFTRLDKHLKALIPKYVKATNLAAKRAGFYIHSVTQKDFLSVQDGISVTRRARRRNGKVIPGTRVNPTKRTLWPGLRRRTGNLARNVNVGVYPQDGSFQVLTSQSTGALNNVLWRAVAVGVNDTVRYGVIHEREGRKQGGLQAGRNFFPFLEPAFKKAWPQVKAIFDDTLREASKG